MAVLLRSYSSLKPCFRITVIKSSKSWRYREHDVFTDYHIKPLPMLMKLLNLMWNASLTPNSSSIDVNISFYGTIKIQDITKLYCKERSLLNHCIQICINTLKSKWSNSKSFSMITISFWLQGRTNLLCGRGVVLKRHSVVLHVEGL